MSSEILCGRVLILLQMILWQDVWKIDVFFVKQLNRCILRHILCFVCLIVPASIPVYALTSHVMQHIVVPQSIVKRKDTCSRPMHFSLSAVLRAVCVDQILECRCSVLIATLMSAAKCLVFRFPPGPYRVRVIL